MNRSEKIRGLIQPLGTHIKHHALPLTLLVSVLFFIYWPVLPLNIIATKTHYGDAMINCYLINWFQYGLWMHPFSAFDAPLFYPQETSGAFSSINLFLCLITGPLQLLHNPVFAYNAAIYLAVILSGFSMYACTYLLFKNRKASLVAGILFSCNSDMIWHFFGHPNIISPIFIPPIIYLAVRLFQEPRSLYAVLFCACLYGQFWCGPYLGFISLIGLTPVMLIVLALRFRSHPKPLLVLIGTGIFTLFMVFLLTGPFREVNSRLGSSRSINEMIMNSAELNFGYLLPAFVEKRNETFFGSLLGESTPYNRAVNSQYFGLSVYVAVFLHVAIMLGLSLKQRRLKLPAYSLFFIILLFMGFLFSFGPYLWWKNELTQIKLPMWYVYEYISPLRFLREVSRFAVLVVAGLGFLIALAISQWSWVNERQAAVRWGVLGAMLLGLIVEFRPIASPAFASIDMRPYALIATHPEINRMASVPPTNYTFLIQSTATFPQTPSGYKGGVYNHHYETLEPVLGDFSSNKATALYGALGVEAVFVNGAANLEIARSKPELEPLSPDPNAPFGLFRLLPDRIDPAALAEAKTFLASVPEFPPFDIVPDAELQKSPYSFPIEVGGRQELYYNSVSLSANAGQVPIYNIPINRINSLMMRMSLSGFGVDYVDSKIYYKTDREPEFSEDKSITVHLPPDNQLHWAKFDFHPQHSKFGNHNLTGIRFQFSATPYPGQEAVVESIYLDLTE